MEREQVTAHIIETLKAKNITYQQVSEAVGRSLVWTTLALHGQATMDKSEAEKAGALLSLTPEQIQSLQDMPSRGSLDIIPPTDPTIYRFYELVLVYGTTLKALINEKFGDGIMSAIDFTMDMEKVPNPNGDRVKITMEGKFLPYKKW